MHLTPEQTHLANTIADFCRNECGTSEQRAALTENGTLIHSRELFERVADLGWAGLAIPEEYGGSGGTLVDLCVFFEETSRGMAPIAAAASSHLVASVLLAFGNERQKKQRLSGIAAGNTMSISISEPEAGSDLTKVACKADIGQGGFVVNGHKTWASYAHLVDRLIIVVRTYHDPDNPHMGLTMLDVDPHDPAVDIREIPTLGPREINDIYLTDLHVQAHHVVGTVNDAWRQMMTALNRDRLIIAAQGIGHARRVLEDAIAHLKNRRQFDAALSDFQALRHRLADLATEIEAAKTLTYSAAYRLQHGMGTRTELNRLTSMAKLKSTETARNVAMAGVQLLGGNGYTTEFDMQHILQKSIAATIYGGTNEIQREIVAKTLL